MSHMPWEMLKLATLQVVLNDLGLSKYTNTTLRQQLVKILRDVETDGLEAVSQELEDRQLAADRARSPSFSYVPNRPEESPELGYTGHPPRPVPIVEIRSHRPHPNAEAGPSRVRVPIHAQNHHGPGASTNRTSAVPLTRVGPPAKKRKMTVMVAVPPPSYAILYRQHQEIAPPAKDRYPLLRPNQRFDGVHLPAPRRHVRLAGPADPEHADARAIVSASANVRDVSGLREDDDAGPGTGASGHVNGERTHVGAPESPTSLRRLEAVVVTPVEAVKARWGREVNGDMED